MLEATRILQEEGEATMNTIAANIFRNKQNATGTAIQSLKTKANDYELSISGVDYLKNLEKGTPRGTYVSASKINEWANAKGYWEGYSYRANTISELILKSGSVLFREGGRTDVYTDKIPLLINRILQRIGKLFIDYKIIK